MPLPPLESLPEPLGKGTRSCPLCHTGEYLRRRPPVTYCLKCMTGVGDNGAIVACELFPALVAEREETFGKAAV